MRKIIVVLIVTCTAFALKAQPVIAYWDSAKGIKKSESNFKDGMQQGPFKIWFKDGKVAEQGFFKRGYQDSVWNNFYENGKLKGIKNYKKGKPKGQVVFFISNGDTAEVNTYVNGMKDGRWQTWFENGKVSTITPYKNDLKE